MLSETRLFRSAARRLAHHPDWPVIVRYMQENYDFKHGNHPFRNRFRFDTDSIDFNQAMSWRETPQGHAVWRSVQDAFLAHNYEDPLRVIDRQTNFDAWVAAQLELDRARETIRQNIAAAQQAKEKEYAKIFD